MNGMKIKNNCNRWCMKCSKRNKENNFCTKHNKPCNHSENFSNGKCQDYSINKKLVDY